MEKSGAQSSTTKKPGHTWVLGVVTHPNPDMKAHYFAENFRGIRDALSGQSCTLIVNPATFDLHGMLLLAPSKQHSSILDTLEEKQIPAVVVNGYSSRFPSVDLDNVTAAYEAMCHLLRMGHKRVAIINGKIDTDNAKDRFIGYRKALKTFGIPFDEALVAYGEFERAKGYAAMLRLLSLDKNKRPTAVFAANDYMAIGGIRALNEKGLRVPQDVAVVGFDDMEESSHTEPPLTTVRQPFFQMAYEAVPLLLDAITGRSTAGESRRLLLEGKLIVRKSCGAGTGVPPAV